MFRPSIIVRTAALAAAIALSFAPSPAAGANLPAGGRHANVRGIRMYYEIHGKGPALILLHGGAGYGNQFSRQVPAFEQRYRVIVPDACGQGRTTDRPESLSYHAMAEDVIALMDKLRVRTADVMGWSDGGVIGLDLAIHHPGRVKHVVTFGANSAPDGLNPADVAWNDTATAAGFGDDLRHELEKISPHPDHVVEMLNKIIVMWRTQPHFTPAELGSIRAKTLIAAGEHDLVRRDHSQQLASAIPGAQLWIVPGASHSAMQEQPDLVNAHVLDFLSK